VVSLQQLLLVISWRTKLSVIASKIRKRATVLLIMIMMQPLIQQQSGMKYKELIVPFALMTLEEWLTLTN
jgi:hypothetical protein